MKDKLIERHLETVAAYNRAIQHDANEHEIEYRRVRMVAQRQLLTESEVSTIFEQRDDADMRIVSNVTADGKTYTWKGSRFVYKEETWQEDK